MSETKEPERVEMQWWPVGLIRPTPDNPRRAIDVNAPAFRELVESVRVHGILQPLIARLHPTESGALDLRAGNRRWLAAIEAGLAEVPVMVREMDDRTAMEITVLENMNREDLTPMEEARGVDALIRTGHDLDEISERLGKTRGWVARRAGLLALTKAWIRWAEEWKVSAAHMELLARLPKPLQDQLFEEITVQGGEVEFYFFGPGSLNELRERLNGAMRRLKLAPWGLEDAMLVPVAGSCEACTKRTGCQPDLFVDAEEQLIGDEDRCLDAECWGLKARASKAARAAELAAKHGKVLKLSSRGGRGGKGVLDWWNFEEAAEGDEGAVPGVYDSGEKEGMLAWVKPTRGGQLSIEEEEQKLGKRAEKAQHQAKASMDPEASAALLAEKLAGLEARRWKWVGEKLHAALEMAEEPVAEEYRTAEGLCRLAAGFGAGDGSAGDGWREAKRPYGKDLAEGLWLRIRWSIARELDYRIKGSNDSEVQKEVQKEAYACVAYLLGIHVGLLKIEADEAILEPATWQQLRKLTEAPAPAEGGGEEAAPKKMRGKKAKVEAAEGEAPEPKKKRGQKAKAVTGGGEG
jgi:ParB/RepB/Spo0J family partition protein